MRSWKGYGQGTVHFSVLEMSQAAFGEPESRAALPSGGGLRAWAGLGGIGYGMRRGKSKNLKEDLGTSWWAGPKDPSLADTGLTTAPQVHLDAGGHTWHFRTWPPHFQENPPPSSKEGSLQAGMIWGQPGTRAATQTLSLHLGPSSAAGVLLRVAQPAYVIVPSA